MAYVLHRRAQRMTWNGSCNEGSREGVDKMARKDAKTIKKLERRRQKSHGRGRPESRC
jgi:hypothetical protein